MRGRRTDELLAGTITPALLIIAGAFTIVIYGLLFLLTNQFDYSNRQVASESAFDLAEAGVNYYRWHLAHDPDDFVGDTGEHEYTDPQGRAIGKFDITVTPPTLGSSIVTISSTGWIYQYPNIKRTVTVQYGIPSFARYSFLTNASSWYGSGITVNGLVHSNSGIRQDGTNLSLMSSGQQTYVCGSETGCTSRSDCQDPPESNFCTWNTQQSRCECPGVWGEGGDDGLWQFPVTPVNFEGISFDFTNMSQAAVSDGLYLPASNDQGYHIVFNADGTFNVYEVLTTNYYNHYISGSSCERLYERIASQTPVGTYNVSDRPIIFAEDHVWVEGTVNGRVTIVAARSPFASNYMNIWISGNITYQALDGNHVLGLIAQNDIYFTRDIPENFRVDAALMAKSGKVIRHRYDPCSGNNSTVSVKDSLTINGALLSYLKSYWNYGSPPVSGFVARQINYDANLLYAPPPYFPTSGEYEFISWIEE